MERLRVRDLTVEFHSGGYALRPLDMFGFDAEAGELVLVLGPSGSGKTTLLSCLAGILTPRSGTIRLDDTEITRLSPAQLTEFQRYGVGIVFQGFKLVPSLTAAENVSVALRVAGVPGKVARRRAEELLADFSLSDRLNNRPGALSGGQQQRVAFARALAHDPPLILADEPTAQLDYIQVETVIRALRKLAAPGRLVIVSTHDQRLVPLADRVLRMDGGEPQETHLPRQFLLTTNQILFRQGTRGDLIFVVEEGAIDLVRQRADGSEELVHTSKPGEYFGELAPLLGFPRSATARACETTIVTGYTAAEFRNLPDGRGEVSDLGRLLGPSPGAGSDAAE